jgi:transposase-like protein
MNRNYSEIMGLKGKLSASEVAQKHGIPEATVRKWWKGVYKPSHNSTRAIPKDKRISIVIATLSKHCADFFISTEELCELACLSRDQVWHITTNLQQYCVAYKGQYWWSTLSNTKKIKELMQ